MTDEYLDMDAHIKKFEKWYESGILKPDHHARLVSDIERVAQTAKILPRFIANNMSECGCTEAEIDWLRDMKYHRENGHTGMVYLGGCGNVADRMMAVAGACLRNYIDARMFTIQEVVDGLKDHSLPDSRVMLVPNFFLMKTEGGDLPSWQTSSLLGWLYSRYSSGKYTVLYVYSLNELASGYGVSFKDHIKQHYIPIKK